MKKLTKKFMADWSATIAGIVVAVATGWSTISWKEFDITKEWPHLIVTAAIALGGYLSTFKIKENSNSETKDCV